MKPDLACPQIDQGQISNLHVETLATQNQSRHPVKARKLLGTNLRVTEIGVIIEEVLDIGLCNVPPIGTRICTSKTLREVTREMRRVTSKRVMSTRTKFIFQIHLMTRSEWLKTDKWPI